MSPAHAAKLLVETTITMFHSNIPLMRRVLPHDVDAILWDHYPDNDAVSAHHGSRYFYHCHPVEERGAGEHGHFHLFMSKQAMQGIGTPLCAPTDTESVRADVVHIAAVSISPEGLPLSLFTVNRWVCDEWLYSRGDIMSIIDGFDLTGADGDILVNDWLTALVHLTKPIIATLLAERDDRLAAIDWNGEDRNLEVTSIQSIDLQALVEPYMAE
jgi:hypothetical protein